MSTDQALLKKEMSYTLANPCALADLTLTIHSNAELLKKHFHDPAKRAFYLKREAYLQERWRLIHVRQCGPNIPPKEIRQFGSYLAPKSLL